MKRAALALVFLTAPSTSIHYGASPNAVSAAETRSARRLFPLVLTKSPLGESTGRGKARTCGSGSLTQHSSQCCSRDSKGVVEALALVRGGGDSQEDSVFTLLVRVFVPSFKRESEAKDGGLDLHGGGVMRRLKRLMSGILRKVSGSPKDDTSEGETGEKEVKKIGKANGKGANASHLEKTYRPGNANYRIQKELKEFMASPPDNCKVSVGKNIRVWIITISGAEGTIYAGEKFRLRVAFPEDYPTKPPAVYFLQSPPPPKHQHIYTNGDICLSLLSSRDWKPNLTVMSLALSILSMLSSAKEKRIPEDNAAHADARPGQAQQWIYHDDLC